MKVIRDKNKIKEIEDRVQDIVTKDMYDLNIDYLERMKWVAIPIDEHPYYVAFEDESFYNDSFFEEKNISYFL